MCSLISYHKQVSALKRMLKNQIGEINLVGNDNNKLHLFFKRWIDVINEAKLQEYESQLLYMALQFRAKKL